MKSTTTIAPMQMQRSHTLELHAIEGMRLLDGETEADKAAREAAEAEAARVAAEKAAADKAAADKAAADKAEADRVAAEKAEADRIAADKAAGKLTDKEHEFLIDALKHKKAAREAQAALDAANARIKAFDGLDPEQIKKLVDDQAKAAKAAKDAELKAAEAAGDVERIKKMMGEEHNKVVEQLKTELATKDATINGAQKTIEDLTVGSAFSQSTYIKDELVLTPAIARQVYSSHFDVVGGKVVPFDKPRGESGRTQLVDASGAHLSVDAALKKIVEASPDRDRLVRSKVAPGARSTTDKTRDATDHQDDGLRGAARIQAAIVAGAFKKAGTK